MADDTKTPTASTTPDPMLSAATTAAANDAAAEKKLAEDRAALQKKLATQPFVFHGAIGTPFNIEAQKDGQGFGDTVGTVTIAGRLIQPTAWSDTVIKGFMPADIKPGDVEIVVNGHKLIKTFGKV